jgi:hypothetical protein
MYGWFDSKYSDFWPLANGKESMDKHKESGAGPHMHVKWSFPGIRRLIKTFFISHRFLFFIF